MTRDARVLLEQPTPDTYDERVEGLRRLMDFHVKLGSFNGEFVPSYRTLADYRLLQSDSPPGARYSEGAALLARMYESNYQWVANKASSKEIIELTRSAYAAAAALVLDGDRPLFERILTQHEGRTFRTAEAYVNCAVGDYRLAEAHAGSFASAAEAAQALGQVHDAVLKVHGYSASCDTFVFLCGIRQPDESWDALFQRFIDHYTARAFDLNSALAAVSGAAPDTTIVRDSDAVTIGGLRVPIKHFQLKPR